MLTYNVKSGCKLLLVLVQPYPRQSGVDSQNDNLILSFEERIKIKREKGWFGLNQEICS